MTAPVYVREDLAGAIADSKLLVEGPEAHHAATVRRARSGERVDVVDGAGLRARCTVVASAKGRLVLDVVDLVREDPPTPSVTLVQALAKSGRDLQAVETATEYGASRIVPWAAERSIPDWKSKEDKGRARWQATALAAAKQSRRAWVPEVTGVLRTSEIVAMAEREAAEILVCHEEATEPLGPTDAADVWIVVGPEGGIAENEIASFARVGAKTVLLGPRVLRSASAGPFAIAALAGMRLAAS